MATLDATTQTEYLAQSTASARAQAVVSALSGTVTFSIRNGAHTVMATGTMGTPWATESNGSIVLGELASPLTVSIGGTPDSNWYIEFTNGTRWITGSFGLSGSAAEFDWSLGTFQAGQTATIGTADFSASAQSGIQAASASQADVEAAITSASPGDTVNVPAGSATWNGLTIAKPISLVGAGIGQTNITITTGENTITKQATGITYMRGFSFSRTSQPTTYAWIINGNWSDRPVIIEECAHTVSDASMYQVTLAGGLIIAKCTFSGLVDDSFIRPKTYSDDESWTTNRTWGTEDTNGENNIYVEDCYFYGGGNQGIDADDASRVVYRYNRLVFSSFNTHGWATSSVGVRHFEVYNNDFQYPYGNAETITNVNRLIWIRGGAGVIADNTIAALSSQEWGEKPTYMFTIRSAEDALIMGSPPSCGATSYPVPRQIGQGYVVGTGYVTDKIWVYGNTGTGAGIDRLSADWNWGNPCGFTWSDFCQAGRDYEFNNGSPGSPPGYTKYTYPHPLRVSTGQAY